MSSRPTSPCACCKGTPTARMARPTRSPRGSKPMPASSPRPTPSPPNCAPRPRPILLCSSLRADSSARRWGEQNPTRGTHKREEAMKLSRRRLAAAGALALAAPALVRSAEAQPADEAAVKKIVEELRTASIKQDKTKLESLTAAQLSYSHSDAKLQNKAEFIDGVMTRKGTVKSLEWPDLTVQIVGNNGVVRHLWVSESELDGKVTNTKIGVMQVWQKQDGAWKLLARASWKLPAPA